MKKITLTFIFIIIVVAFYIKSGSTADLKSRYINSAPNYHRQLIQDKVNTLPITILSNNVKKNYLNSATFNGNVDINQGNMHLQADKVQLYQIQPDNTKDPALILNAQGNVKYKDNHIILKGSKAWSNLTTKDINVWECDYRIIGRQIRGRSEIVKQNYKNRYTVFSNSSFTSCQPNSNNWNILGSEVIYDHEEQLIKIWHARFQLGSVPIFYSPYLRLPIGNKRRSGFLTPNIKYSSKNYFELYFPYYLNITPNIDITITPHYVQKHNNVIWENELRYLTQAAGTGLMEIHYLPYDKVFKNTHQIKDMHHHWLYYWQHSSLTNQLWRFNINYTKASDLCYFNDFSLKNIINNDNYIKQIFSASYDSQNFDAIISARQFKICDNKDINTYNSKPQLTFNFYKNIKPFNIKIHGQAINFVNKDPNMPQTQRIHLEPIINLPWSNNWASLNTEFKLMTTYYQQNNLNNYNKLSLKKTVKRILPKIKIDTKLAFERDISFIDYIQTLEPHIQYLYVPYHDQKKINNYDSSLLQYDYSNVFYDLNYSGLDRIASANHVATSITSRVLDKNIIERFKISIGQIYYFVESRTFNNNINHLENNKIGSLYWAGDAYWNMSNNWSLHGGAKYNTHLDNITNSGVSVEYQRDEKHVINFTYHYHSSKYIQDTLFDSNTAEHYNYGISQISGAIKWPMTNHWSALGTYYFNIDAYNESNQQLVLKYDSCCYAIYIGYERKFHNWNIESNKAEYNNILGFNIALRGLNSKIN